MASEKLAITEFSDVRVSEEGNVVSLTFEQLAIKCSKPAEGAKHGKFWVRGELSPPERKTANLKYSRLLVIDGDRSLDNPDSAPSVDDLHEILTEWGIKHFIYTTHGHGDGKNKFRCVIECNLRSEDQLKLYSKKACETLNKAGYPIQWVKEMGAWIQPWFYPRRDDPNDGQFQFRHYMEGTPLEIDDDEVDETRTVSGDKSSWRDKLNEIKNGVTYHEHIRDITWGGVKDGVDPAMLQDMVEFAMSCVPAEKQDERWQERFDSIPRLIREADAKINKEVVEVDVTELEIPDIPPPVLEGKIPLPGGLLGELVASAYNYQRYKYEELALVTALGLVAGICGRKYNMNGTGLNVYLTMIMGTGTGKDTINEFMERTMVGLNYNNVNADPLSFLGASRFTGPKALYNGLNNALSQACVLTEAGLLLGSKVGDTAGLTRALLSLYTLSGKGRFSKPELFSSDDNSIKRLQGPALTIINEATPITLLKAMHDTNSIETGDLPRQSIFRISREKPRETESKFELSNMLNAKLTMHVEECSKIQADSKHEVIDIVIPPSIMSDVKDHGRYWVDKQNEYSDVNVTASNMASRMHVKALKFAGIASVMNNGSNFVSASDWDWAKNIIQYEYDGVDRFFAGGSGIDVDGNVKTVSKTVIGMLNGEYKDKKIGLDVRYRDRKIVSRTNIRQALRNNKQLAEMNQTRYGKIMLGVDVILNKMVEDGLLKDVNDPFGNKAGCMQITSEFKNVFNYY